MILLAILACTTTAPDAIGTTPTSDTTHTGTPSGETADTGIPGSPLLVDDHSGAACPAGTYSSEPPVLAATAAPGTVTLDRRGEIGGCGCTTTVTARADPGTSTLTVNWGLGDCDVVLCCELDTTLSGVPAGTWTVGEWGGGPTAGTTVVVP